MKRENARIHSIWISKSFLSWRKEAFLVIVIEERKRGKRQRQNDDEKDLKLGRKGQIKTEKMPVVFIEINPMGSVRE